jgi:acyl-CoA thioesterase-2
MMAASLDHALWIHRPFRVDEWLLYRMSSSNMSNARGLARGEIFSRDGKLVASVMQEGLIRRLDPSKKRGG